MEPDQITRVPSANRRRRDGQRATRSRALRSGAMEPVLPVRQPWASATFHAGKTVENRRKRTHYRGRLWIHAGTFAGRDEPDEWARDHDLWLPEEPLPRGVILGSVELV